MSKPGRLEDATQFPVERILAATWRLFELGDVASLERVIAAAEAFVAVHDSPEESPAAFRARLDALFPTHKALPDALTGGAP